MDEHLSPSCASRIRRAHPGPSPAVWLVSCITALDALTAVGCIASERLSPDNFDAPGTDPVLSAYDWAGRPTPLDEVARKPSIEIEIGTRVDGSNEPALLFEGTMDDELLEDLARAPLRAAHLERTVDCAFHYLDTEIIFVPRSTLKPGFVYTAALGGWARGENGASLYRQGEVFYRELRVSRSADSGARPVGSWPADGSAGVPPNLSFAAVAFDGEIQGEQEGIWLQDPRGFAVPARIGTEPCENIGWRNGTCVRIEPEAWLAAGARYRLAVGGALRDARGSPVETWSASFITATVIDHAPPSPAPGSCAVDEFETETGCALVDDGSLRLRLGADEPVIFRLSIPGVEDAPVIRRVASRGEAEIRLTGLEADALVSMEITARDAAENESSWSLLLRTEAGLPRLSITEIRADPRGPEPHQEFIEITNWGDEPVDLQGFSVSDDAYEVGDTIGRSAVAHPGASVLLVADRFDPEEPRDDPAPPGVAVVRVGASLADSGLSNSGEPLYLRDPAGRRVSAAPASPRPRAGVCLVRVSEDMRDGSPGSFDYDEEGRCTPGY